MLYFQQRYFYSDKSQSEAEESVLFRKEIIPVLLETSGE